MATMKIESNSTLHAMLISRLSSRIKIAEQEQSKHHPRWKEAEERMVAYLPQNNADVTRSNRRDNGEPQYTTIQIPYTFAVVMTAHTYWTSVLFGRNPIHQFTGRHGEGEMQIQAMEALVQYQVDVGQMMAPYYLWMYDGAKYGLGILGTWWDKQVIYYGSIEKDELTGQLLHVTRKVEGYEGNCAYNVSPFDFLPDPRVTIGQYQRGEFLGIKTRMAWHEIQARRKQGEYMNIDKLPTQPSNREEQSLGSSQVERPQDNWSILDDADDAATGKNSAKAHPARVSLYEVYVRLEPEEWGLGNSTNTEMWCFTLTSDKTLIIGAQPVGLAHGRFPFDVFEPEMEAYGTYNRGLPEMVKPLQQTMDWLINTHFYNTRAILNNQLVIDPSRIVMKDVEKGGPGFVFRMRPEAFGQDVRTMIHQVPLNDVTGTHMNDLQTMLAIGERTMGINEQMFGVMANGGRKTATEVRTSTGFGVNRQKTQVEWGSATAFAPHASKLVMSTQQYYSAQKKMRIAGDLSITAGQKFLMVSPEDIVGAYDLVPVDGSLPADRFAQATMWKDMLSQLVMTPAGAQLFAQFDIGKLFGWVMGLMGIKNVNQFRIQVLPPGQGPSADAMPLPIGQPGIQPPGSSSSTMAGGANLAANAQMGAGG